MAQWKVVTKTSADAGEEPLTVQAKYAEPDARDNLILKDGSGSDDTVLIVRADEWLSVQRVQSPAK